ncbi:MAG: hypothetical protein DI555_07150 [Novosphingobium pentaromativorans]|uniref:Uncharacterized protein n=1 Tax=Novosphingobium pentaromativorans TaxID=205844 RepID=A0A2W5NQW5_9SPHN|nr:MAG: hypothetical protein DI555_07150 [Novosphingobium pentaromativorans]
MNWITSPATGLEEAIARFKSDLPGWWFSVGECQVSCDASCAPTSETMDIGIVGIPGSDDRFDSGFHADLEQPSTLAEALDDVRMQALEALGKHKKGEVS